MLDAPKGMAVSILSHFFLFHERLQSRSSVISLYILKSLKILIKLSKMHLH